MCSYSLHHHPFRRRPAGGTNWSVPKPNEASSWKQKRTKRGGLRLNNTHSWRKASEYKNAKNWRPERAVRWHHTKDWILVEVFEYRTDLFKMPCHEFDKDYGQATMNKKKNRVCQSVVENPKLLTGCHPTRLQLESNCAICNNKASEEIVNPPSARITHRFHKIQPLIACLLEVRKPQKYRACC